MPTHVKFKVEVGCRLSPTMTTRGNTRLLKERSDLFTKTHKTIGKNNIGSAILICLIFTRKHDKGTGNDKTYHEGRQQR